ncbi:hypothetical protein CVT26_012331, partial [Gymnopilus dilepis]
GPSKHQHHRNNPTQSNNACDWGLTKTKKETLIALPPPSTTHRPPPIDPLSLVLKRGTQPKLEDRSSRNLGSELEDLNVQPQTPPSEYSSFNISFEPFLAPRKDA